MDKTKSLIQEFFQWVILTKMGKLVASLILWFITLFLANYIDWLFYVSFAFIAYPIGLTLVMIFYAFKNSFTKAPEISKPNDSLRLYSDGKNTNVEIKLPEPPKIEVAPPAMPSSNGVEKHEEVKLEPKPKKAIAPKKKPAKKPGKKTNKKKK